MEPWERTEPRAAPISLPSPYVTNPSPLFMSPGQKSDGTEGRGGGPGRNGPSNPGDRRNWNDADRRTSDRRTGDAGDRRTNDEGPQPHTASSRWDPQTKRTRHPSEAQFKERRFGQRSPDGSARAPRGPRSAPGPARSHGGPPRAEPPVRGPPHGGRPHASRVTFEVKMADFPELAAATPGTSAPPAPSWGQKPLTQGPHTQGPHTQGPHTQGPLTQGPHTQGPHTQGPHTQGPHTQGPHTQGPHSRGPPFQGPHTQGPHTQGPHSRGPPFQGPHTQGPHSRGPVSPNKTQSVNERPAGSPGPRRHARDVRPVSASSSPDGGRLHAVDGGRLHAVDGGRLHAVRPGPVKASPGGLERPASASTSWANVASQPPRKPAPREDPFTAAQEEQEDGSSERKKRKRKKKPPRTSEEEPEEPTPLQEPPKFEDEEEFPDLGRPSAGASRPSASNPPAPPGTQKTEKASGKKSKVPLQLDIGTMLEVLERKQQSHKSKPDAKPLYLSVGGACPVSLKQPLVQKKGAWQQDKFAHNPLDSTMVVKKGKQREVPKAKKPTQLKRVILKEREERKQNRLDQERALDPHQDPRPDQERAVGAHQDPRPDQDRAVDPHQDPRPDLERAVDPHQDPRPDQETAVDPHQDPRPDEPSAGEQALSGDTGKEPGEEPGEEPADQRHLADSDAEEEREEEEEEVEEQQEEVEEQQQEEQQQEVEEVEQQEEVEEEEEPEGQPEEPAAVEPLPPPTPHNPPKIHSRKFRDYCSQVLSKEVDECVSALLRELVRFQDRLYQKDPMKARMKKRLVMGLREVLKHLRLGKVKCVVISPNCERSQSKGGLDEALHTIIEACRQRAVPLVFALSRKALGRCVNKAVPVSLVGIFNYDGAQDFYHKMIELSSEARKAYEEVLERVELGGAPEEEGVEEEDPGQKRLRPGAPPPPPARVEEVEEKEEPEYISCEKSWRTIAAARFLNFEEQLGSLRLDGEEPQERAEQS
ncbi:unnamed protein product [Boreogadus saida]